MPHVARPALKARHPVHVTMRLEKGIPSLRRHPLSGVVLSAFRSASRNPEVQLAARLVHFSIQSNHLHLIVETDDEWALSRAMKGLAIRIALRLNRLLGRRGRVFSDRYHARALRTPTEVRRALVYVLRNDSKHRSRVHEGSQQPTLDPLSTADYFDGFTGRIERWRRKRRTSRRGEPPVAEPMTWLLRIGWKQLGLIGARDAPSGA
jgi:REP element-mobilizing transposase RayT